MEIKPVLIFLLFVSSGLFYYSFTGNVIASESYTVERVIDGDTLEIEGGHKVRLKGINAPESSMPYHDEATFYLKNTLENQTITLENYGVDKYGRILGHVFFEGESINERLLLNGMASLYYYEKDEYFEDLFAAEELARAQGFGIWAKSPHYGCIEVLEFKFEENNGRCIDDEKIIFTNTCEEIIQFLYKDDATHIFYEVLKGGETISQSFSCVWNDDGDSLYAFDQEGLILFYRYS